MSHSRQAHGYGISHAGRLFAGLLVGGLAGAGAMLLLAPQSGKKTRDQIQHQGLELRDQVTETVEDTVSEARGRARRMTDRLRKQTRELQHRGQDILDQQKEVVSHAVEAEKQAIHSLTDG